MSERNPPQADQIIFYFRQEKGVLFVVAVTGVLYNLGMVVGPWFEGQMLQRLCDIIQRERNPAEMLPLALCYVLAIAFVQLMRYFKRLYVRMFANHISKRIKMTLFQNMLLRKKAVQEESGSMMTKLISDADACVEGMRKFTTEVFDTGIVMIAYTGMLLFYDWKLALLSLLFPPIAYFLAEKLKTVVTKSVAASRESSARLNTATLERIQNALTYRVYGQETNQNQAYEAYLSDYEKKAVRANIWENAMQPVYQVVSMLGCVAVIWLGGRNVSGTGWAAWNIAAFTTFFSCYKKLAVKSSRAAKLFNAVQKAKVSWKRIKPYLQAVSREPERAALPGGSLLVSGLAFAYPGQAPLFSGVSFSARKGQIFGIAGEVACGKSTLGRLFTGELPYEGRISIGTFALPNAGEGFAGGVGYLGHQPELFGGTLEENICLGKPGDVLPVLRAVCIDAEAAVWPDGIHTVIGSGGVRLSGGQQARIALARTLYHKKPLMVLDDPFSAVDFETERQIFAQIRQSAADCIVLLISHRLTLFPEMDGVIWMENGSATVASHSDLFQKNEHYHLHFTMQQEGKHES